MEEENYSSEKQQQMEQEDRIILYDNDIREPLFDYLEERFGKIRIFEEKIIGKSRADLLVLTASQIIGPETKSDADTYERLERQVQDYNRCYDANYIVIGKSHEKHVEEHIPREWGILTVRMMGRDFVVEEMHPAMPNPKMKQELQITLFWCPELQHLLEINHLPKYKQKSKRFVQQKFLEKMEWRQSKPQICEELFERDYTLWEEDEELLSSGTSQIIFHLGASML